MKRRALAVASAAILLGAADPNPDASLWIEELHVGLFGRSRTVGGGRLRYRGEIHSFSIQGLSVAASGFTSVRAQGEVFDLRRLEDFTGSYREVRPPGPDGDGPVEVHWLRSERGVRIRMRSSRAGARLRFDEAGLAIELGN